MLGTGQGSKGDMKRARDSTGGGPLDHEVLVMGTAGPTEQELVRAYTRQHEHEKDVDFDSSEEEEGEERPVKRRTPAAER